MSRIFVYGTLKKGHGNNRLLSMSTFLGREILNLPYEFVCLGGFPGIVRTSGAHSTRPVGGEVWEVDDVTLRRLDQLEGHPNFYTRTEITSPNYGVVWTYTLPSSYLIRERVDDVFWRQSEAEAAFVQQTAADNA